MRVHLAGFNVDTEVLKELEKKAGKRSDITPEVLSAAYARISRDPRPISVIRKDARNEVEKTRRSNSTIIFKMGHHSVAEHAIFNLDIVGVSRYAMEEVEKFRLSSYTEKSQRYITLDRDFVVPEEIKKEGLENKFTEIVHVQNKAYFEFLEKLKDHVFVKYKDLAKDPRNHGLLEGWAKEDARYITSLAAESQVGQTINARNLELMLRRFASHPLSEVRGIGRAIYKEIIGIAPSIVIFHKANDSDLKMYPELKSLTANMLGKKKKSASTRTLRRVVELTGHTSGGDDTVIAALLHTSSDMPFKKCVAASKRMSIKNKKDILKTVWRYMQFYDSMPREFEYIELTYNMVLSAACFGQLKRHRMSTITVQPYDPDLGVTIPGSIKETGMEKKFRKIIKSTEKVYRTIRKKTPLAAAYVLTNAHRRRVLMRLNARELYHISRLREDTHAQWDIQNLSREMTKQAKKAMPVTFGLIGGKDRYNEIYKSVYGTLPKITEAVLPGSRKIK